MFREPHPLVSFSRPGHVGGNNGCIPSPSSLFTFLTFPLPPPRHQGYPMLPVTVGVYIVEHRRRDCTSQRLQVHCHLTCHAADFGSVAVPSITANVLLYGIAFQFSSALRIVSDESYSGSNNSVLLRSAFLVRVLSRRRHQFLDPFLVTLLPAIGLLSFRSLRRYRSRPFVATTKGLIRSVGRLIAICGRFSDTGIFL